MTIEERHVGREKSRREKIEGTALKYNKKKGGFVERRDNDRKLGFDIWETEYTWMVGITGVGSISEYKPACKGFSLVEVHSCSSPSVPYIPPLFVHERKKDRE